jgi:hypothetical protein
VTEILVLETRDVSINGCHSTICMALGNRLSFFELKTVTTFYFYFFSKKIGMTSQSKPGLQAKMFMYSLFPLVDL